VIDESSLEKQARRGVQIYKSTVVNSGMIARVNLQEALVKGSGAGGATATPKGFDLMKIRAKSLKILATFEEIVAKYV